MIRQIVFDLGQVLIYFDKDRFIRRLNLPEEDGRLLMNEVFLSLEWAQLDRGSIDDRGAYETIRRRLPQRLHPAAWELISRWDQPLLPVPGMAELVRELKEAGYGLYLLSNASLRMPAYWPRVPGNEFFDGVLLSCQVRYVKPEQEIFRLLFERFGLKPEECFFVDDAPLNIEAAFCAGMAGAVFHGDAEDLRTNLRRAGIQI